MPILNRTHEIHDDVTQWRHHLHENPELGYEEEKTHAFIKKKLDAWGIPTITGLAKTGIVGVIEGKPGKGTIGLRADMDALPIHEQNDLPYNSKTEGKMHACGHDGHMAILLGAAKLLSENRNFHGKVYVIFQPAEEGQAGANQMVKDGLFEQCPVDQVFGLHNMPGLPLGHIHMCPGAIMASADFFDIHIQGKGGHAAMPHTTVDPVMVGSQIVTAMQSVMSREQYPLDAGVVSITQFHAGTADNIIPDTAYLNGTARALSPETRDRLEKRIGEVAHGVAQTWGATVKYEYHRLYPVTINNPDATTFAAEVASEIVGDGNVKTDIQPSMGAEDFSYMLNERPGCYVFLGNGEGSGLHSPTYNFNDDAIPYGVSYFVRLVEKALTT